MPIDPLPLEVVPDPRIQVPSSAYTEQFALAKSVEANRVRVAEALAEAGKLTSALTERRAQPEKKSSALLAALQNEINDHTGADPANAEAWWLPPKSTSSLKFLQGALDKLATSIDDADAAPSADAKASLALLEPQVGAAVDRWKAFRSGVNERLTRGGETAIPMP